MFESLSDRLESAFKVLSGSHRITELNVAESIKEIRRALVAADVNYKIAKDFTDRVKEKALGTENVLKSVSPGQLMIKIVSDELTDLMGGQTVGINVKGHPGVVLVAGLQGSGKTTFSGKLAKYLKEQRKMRPLLVACDVYRPAAIEQLSVLAESIGVAVYKEIENKNPVDIARNAVAFAKANSHDVVIVDTAGRLAVDEVMMDEVENIKKALNPTETLFVVDSMTGQDAVNTAEAFNKRINFDGVVLTKLDGDTRGGAALTIKHTVGKPIKFVSQGEKLDALDVFYPDRMAQRILGMGDIVSLVEKAQLEFDDEEAKRLEKRIKQNKFDFNDFLGQMQMIKKMGDLKSLMSMIPGMDKALKDAPIDDKALVRVEAIIQSMTPWERANPDAISLSRKKRLARGCGQNIDQINLFMKNFGQMRQMMHQVSKMPAGKMGMLLGLEVWDCPRQRLGFLGLRSVEQSYMNYHKYELKTDPETADILVAFLSDSPFDTFEETSDGLNAYAPATASEAEIGAQLLDLQGQFYFTWEKELVLGQNWNELWESNFQPVVVGDFCAVRADFHEPIKDVKWELVINPKMAFGTGHHETTWQCIAAIEHLPLLGAKVLDYGCGTGILAILASKQGASEVEAVDIEEQSYLNTLENSAANGAQNVNARLGTLYAVQGSDFDGILANINRHVILESLPALANLLKPKGWLLISGILLTDEAIVTEAAEAAGFSKKEMKSRGNWLCGVFEK